MLIYLSFILILIIFIKDFKKGIIVYAPFKFMFSYGIASHIGNFTLDTLFTFSLFVVWCFSHKRKLVNFPLKKSVVVMLCATIIYSFNPFFSITTLLDMLSPFVYLLMFFSAINSQKDIQLFVKMICAYVILLNVNALSELAGYNIIGKQLQTIMTSGAYWAEDAGTRGAFFRLHAFVPHSIGYGVENMVFLGFFLMLYVYGEILLKKKISMYFMIVCLIGVFLSGSRSPLLGGIIILLPLIGNRRMFKSQNLLFVSVVSVAIIYFAGSYLSTMFNSLSSEDDVNIGGASSWDMRLGQLEYSVYFWMKNFWFGNGHTFDIFQGGTQYNSIFGAESVWFPIMMKQGLVGMVAYLYITIDACSSAMKIRYKWLCICLMLGWLIIDSATNLPGMNILLPLYFYAIYYKLSNPATVVLKSNS